MAIPVFKVVSVLTQVTRRQTDAWLKSIEEQLGEPLCEVSPSKNMKSCRLAWCSWLRAGARASS